MITYLNHYPNIFTPTVTGTVTNQFWLDQIKDSQHKETINILRNIKRLYVTTNNIVFKNEYDKLKSTLPAITWNGTFTNVKSNDTFIKSSGLLYIDIDDTSFHIETLDLSKVYSYYKSVGGLGYSILVKVKDINKNNFKSTYISICNDLHIEKYIDTNAIKITQYSILSSDSELYINNESFIYSSVSSSIKDNFNFVLPPTLIVKKEEHNVGGRTKLNTKFNNINDFDFNGNDYIVDYKNGLDYIYCSKPFTPLTDGRKRYMLNYIRNYVYLNPTASKLQITNSAKFINISIGIEPLSNSIIESQISNIMKQHGEAMLTPKIKKRRILFNPKSLLTKDEKNIIQGELKSKHYKDVRLQEMYEIIEDWNFNFNGKITIRSVTYHVQFSKSTVEKYWSELKEYVNVLNKEHSEELRLYKQHKMKIDKDIKENNIVPLMVDMTPLNLFEKSLSDDNVYEIEIDELEMDSLLLEIFGS